MNKIIIFGMDGTLTEGSGDDMRVLEGVVEGLEYFGSSGWGMIGITNDVGVAEGEKSIGDVIGEMSNVIKVLPGLDCIYICGDYEGNICYVVERVEYRLVGDELDEEYEKIDRLSIPDYFIEDKPLYPSFWKPGGGMITKGIDDICPDGVSLNNVWVVGDEEDEKAASSLNMNYLSGEKFMARFRLGIEGVKNLSEKQKKFLG